MSHDDDGGSPRKGKLSAFALLKSWLFDKTNPEPAHAETEFLNTRDGYELAKFAKKAFGGDAEAERAQQAAVEAEQAEIDALLQGTGAIPMPMPAVAHPAAPGLHPPGNHHPAPPAAHVDAHPGRAAYAAASAQPADSHQAHPVQHAPVLAASHGPSAEAAPVTPKNPVDVAVKYLEQLRGQGLSVETLAEALIVIESREVRKRAQSGH